MSDTPTPPAVEVPPSTTGCRYVDRQNRPAGAAIRARVARWDNRTPSPIKGRAGERDCQEALDPALRADLSRRSNS